MTHLLLTEERKYRLSRAEKLTYIFYHLEFELNRHEENLKFEEAASKYEYCLELIPDHEEAKNSLQFIKNKLLAAKETKENPLDVDKVRELYELYAAGNEKAFFREMKKLKKKYVG